MTTMFFTFCSGALVSFLLAVPFSLLCEVPFMTLEKLIISGFPKSKHSLIRKGDYDAIERLNDAEETAASPNDSVSPGEFLTILRDEVQFSLPRMDTRLTEL